MQVKPIDYNVTLKVYQEGERIHQRMSDMYDQIPFTEMDISNDYNFYLPLHAINRVHQYKCVIEKTEYPGDYSNSANVISRFNEIKVVIGYQDKIILSHIGSATKDGGWLIIQCVTPYKKNTSLFLRRNTAYGEELFQVTKKHALYE